MIYIGVEGGGTRTRIAIREEGRDVVVHDIHSTIRFLEIGYDTAARRFVDILVSILGSRVFSVRSISIGLAGASVEAEQREFEQAILQLLPNQLVTVHVQSDSTLSLRAAYPSGGSGVMLIAGTGSVALGRDDAGGVHQLGGWGRVLGDEGSGHFIGLHALRHYTRVCDGREASTALSEQLKESIRKHASSDRELRTLIARDELRPSQFAIDVFETISYEGSSRLIDLAAMELAELAMGCARKCDLAGPVVTGLGSIVRNEIMHERLSALLERDRIEFELLDEDAPLHYALQLAEEIGR